MTTYAAAVEDEEMGIHTNKTRRGAIEDALEPLLEAVEIGHKEPGEWTVRVYTDPVWCEKAQQYCDEHDHDEHPRWLEDAVHVDVYFAHPEIEDIGPEWQHVGLIDRLREAFPNLVWERQSDTPGAALSGGTPKGTRHWSIVVEPDLSRWLLHGEFTNFGDDPIGELQAAITAEGREIAWRADRLAATVRALGGQTQSDWRVAIAEDNASYWQRQLARSRDLEGIARRESLRLARWVDQLRAALRAKESQSDTVEVEERWRMRAQAQGRLSDALAELSGMLGERIAGFGQGKQAADLIEADHGPLTPEERASIEAG